LPLHAVAGRGACAAAAALVACSGNLLHCTSMRRKRERETFRPDLRIGAVCLRTALFTEVGFYEACNNKVR
jgi:hypothetical protein